MIRKLNEQHLPHFKRTLCQSDVGLATQRWRNYTGEHSKCKMTALYVLDGVPLCQRHCGDRLITKALAEQEKLA